MWPWDCHRRWVCSRELASGLAGAVPPGTVRVCTCAVHRGGGGSVCRSLCSALAVEPLSVLLFARATTPAVDPSPAHRTCGRQCSCTHPPAGGALGCLSSDLPRVCRCRRARTGARSDRRPRAPRKRSQGGAQTHEVHGHTRLANAVHGQTHAVRTWCRASHSWAAHSVSASAQASPGKAGTGARRRSRAQPLAEHPQQ